MSYAHLSYICQEYTYYVLTRRLYHCIIWVQIRILSPLPCFVLALEHFSTNNNTIFNDKQLPPVVYLSKTHLQMKFCPNPREPEISQKQSAHNLFYLRLKRYHYSYKPKKPDNIAGYTYSAISMPESKALKELAGNRNIIIK